MIVFHHADADGRCSAAIVKKWRQEQGPIETSGRDRLTFIEIDYKDPCPLDQILDNETVVIVDFSFVPEIMKQIMAKTGAIIWCDHHITAKNYGYDFPGVRDFSEKGKAGCECTWEFFFPNITTPPSAITMLGDYDAWKLKKQPECFDFYEGLKMEDQSPTSELWDQLLIGNDAKYYSICNNGRAAIKYRDSYCEQMVKRFGYETEIGGHKAWATNIAGFGSMGFGSKMQEYPICISYIHDGKKFTVSLYSITGVDVSKIAKDNGGGGHKGAAGFICLELPFKKA